MKRIGLIGGLSWESTKYYYEIFNTEVKRRLGASNSCECLIYSVNFQEVADLQAAEDWDRMSTMMADAAKVLEGGGADLLLLGTNTMHLCSPAIMNAVSIPFIHIADAIGADIQRQGLKKVALLGTRFTMTKDVYMSRIKNGFNIDIIVPDADEMDIIHTIIYEELVHGVFKESSRAEYQKIIKRLQGTGAEGVILGCTEIPLLIKAEHADIPVFDTAKLHALKAIELAL